MAKEHFLKESKLYNKTNSIDQSSAEDFFKYLKFVPSTTVQKVYNFLVGIRGNDSDFQHL